MTVRSRACATRSINWPRRSDFLGAPIHGTAMRYLALLLLAPWLIVLGWAYFAYPKSLPRTLGRRLFDLLALALAAIAAVCAAVLGYEAVEIPGVGEFGRASGAIWQQVLPALYGYGACVSVLALALLLRWYGWGRRRG